MKKFLAALALSAAAIVSAPASALVIGTADTESSMPFGSTQAGYTFQQIYSKSSFTAPTTISNLTFYATRYPNGTPTTGTYDIYFSTSALSVASFDETNSTAYPYMDASFTKVFSGTMSALVNNKLVINLDNSFTYDPSTENLVMTVVNRDYAGNYNLFLDADQNNGVMNFRMSSYPYNFNTGLVTGFNEAVAAVPEPATWAMMVAGFGVAGAAMRRRRRVAVAA